MTKSAFSVAAARRLLTSPIVLMTLLAAAVAGFHWWEDYDGGIRTNDVHVYWQYARNLTQGKGFVRNTLSSAEAWVAPDSYRPINIVVYPMMIGALAPIVRHWVTACTLLSSFFYVLTVPLLFMLAKTLYDRKVAIVSCLLFILGQYPLVFALHGGTDTPFLFMFMATLLILLKSQRWYHYIIAAFVFVLANLTRPVGPFYAVPLLFYVTFQKKEGKLVRFLIFFSVLFAGSKIPYLVNVFLFDNLPVYNLPVAAPQTSPLVCHSGAFPGYTATKILAFPDDPLHMIFHHKLVRHFFIEKCLNNISSLIQGFLPSLTGRALLTILAILGLFIPLRTRKKELFKWSLVLCLGIQVGVTIVFLITVRYFYPMLPYVLMSAAALIVLLVSKLSTRPSVRRILYVVILAILILPIGVFHSFVKLKVLSISSFDGKRGRSVRSYEAWGKWFVRNVPVSGKTIVYTDTPWLVDIYGGGDRIVAMTPLTLEMFSRLHQKHQNCDVFVLSSAYIYRGYNEWRAMYNDPRPFLGYVPYRFATNGIEAVTYVRNADRVLAQYRDQVAQSIRNDDLLSALLIASKARKVRPKSEELRLRLDQIREMCARVGEKHLQAARNASKKNELAAFQHYLLASAYVDIHSSDELAPLLDRLSDRGVLKLTRYTNNEKWPIRTTLSDFPYGSVLVDGHNFGREHEYVGGDLDLRLDMGSAVHVSTILVSAQIDAERNSLTNIELFASIDGTTWRSVAATPITGIQDGFHRIVLRDFHAVAPFFRVTVKGNGILPLAIGDIALWGLSESDVRSVDTSKLSTLIDCRQEAEVAHRHVGTVAEDAKASNGHKVVVANGERGGMMGFGSYLRVPAGVYEATFHIKSPSNTGTIACLIDVAADHGHRVIAKNTLLDLDLYENAEAPPKLRFTVGGGDVIECRVYSYGHVPLEYDYVTIIGYPEHVYVNDQDGSIKKISILDVDPL